MTDWLQEDYTALEADDLPAYGNVDFGAQQENYTAIVGSDTNFSPSSSHSPPVTGVTDDQQDIYENVGFTEHRSATNPGAGSPTDVAAEPSELYDAVDNQQPEDEPAGSSGNVKNKLAMWGGGVVTKPFSKPKKPSSIALNELNKDKPTSDVEQSNEHDSKPDNTSGELISPKQRKAKTKKKKERNDTTAKDTKETELALDEKENKEKGKTSPAPKDTAVPNMYVGEPMAGTNKPVGGVPLLLPFREPRQTLRGRRCIRIASGILLFVFVMSVIANIILLCHIFNIISEAPSETPPYNTNGLAQLETAWKAEKDIGGSISSGLLINVASMYNGATCASSSVFDRRRCQYALDGRVDPNIPAWMTETNNDVWINVTFNAEYTVLAAELILNEATETDAEVEMTFSPSREKQKYIFRYHRVDSGTDTARYPIELNATATVAVRLDFRLGAYPKSGFGLHEVRFFGYGDPPENCCPAEFVYSAGLRRCYYFSEVHWNKTKTHDKAQADCRTKGGDLVSINSLAEHDFIRPYLAENYAEVQRQQSQFFTKNNTLYSNHGEFWGGLQRTQDRQDDWRWSGIYTAKYTSWEPGQPGKLEPCMQMRAKDNFRWNDKVCSNKPEVRTLYVCEMESLTVC